MGARAPRAARRLAATVAIGLVTSLAGAPAALASGRPHLRASGAVAVLPGHYSGEDSAGQAIEFYVAAGGGSVQDLYVAYNPITCTNDALTSSDVVIPGAALSRSGAVASTTTFHGEVPGGYTATYTYRFDGRFTRSSRGLVSGAGTLHETIHYTAAEPVTCQSTVETWKASRQSQPVQTTAPPPDGHYAGSDSDGQVIGFYVAAGSRSIEDVYVAYDAVTCSSLAFTYSRVVIPSVPVGRSGSFSAKSSYKGEVPGGYAATFTYQFQGHFHEVGPNGDERVAGQFTETIAYRNSAAQHCTTSLEAWSAQRSAQPAQTSAPPGAGSYGGVDSDGQKVAFYVAVGGHAIQDVNIAYTGIVCSNLAYTSSRVVIASVPVSASGGFDARTTYHGEVAGGHLATYTTVFQGHFHSVGPSGAERVAGQFTETVSFTTTAPQQCTTNLDEWSATRTSQPAQTNAAPPAGSYGGRDSDEQALTFSVGSGGSKLTGISVPYVAVVCTNLAFTSSSLTVPSVTVTSARSFTSSTVVHGTVTGGYAATFTYSFQGHFHGQDRTGVERAAGQFTETIAFTDGSPVTCTSNLEAWSATKG